MADVEAKDGATISEAEIDGVPTSELEKLQFFAEENLESFEEQKSLQNDSHCDDFQKYIPGPLPKGQISLDDIRQRLLSLVIEGEDDEDENGVIYTRPQNVSLEEIQKISLVSHSLAALLSTYDEYLVRKIALQIFSESTLWINRLFQFFDTMAYFHRDTKEGLLRVIRLVLHIRYPKYSNHGYEALYTRPPVIYFNGVCWPGLEQYLCSELGLPFSCITSVPSGNTSATLCQLDVASLEKLIVDDSTTAKMPLMVVASAGSHLLGQVDDLIALGKLCRAHNVWLHIEGHSLASLVLEASHCIPSEFADSMTLYMGKWIGISDLPSVTLYKGQEAAHVHASGLRQNSHTLLESTLPLWVTVQALGYDSIARRIQNSLELTSYLLNFVKQYPEFQILGRETLQSCVINDSSESGERTKKPFDDVPSVIVFQYFHRLQPDKEQTSSCDEINAIYYDNLNTWLVQLLARGNPRIKTDIVDLDTYGTCLRVCFLESAYVMNTDKKDIDYYNSCLQHQIGILNSTVRQKELLYQNRDKYGKLQLVQITEWAGMGGARYIPDMWVGRLNELTDTGKEDINILNSELVAKLKTSDSAFSVGEADDGMLCVRFGMVDEDLNIDELITHVIAVGQEIEDSSRFLERMAEMVKHGIEEANKELVLENQEKIMQEGVLKQVPVIGSLVSWWYPTQTETGIKGRSFDLSSGTIESTENIYKYHMQIKEGVPQTPPPSTKVLISPTSLATSQQSTPNNHQSS